MRVQIRTVDTTGALWPWCDSQPVSACVSFVPDQTAPPVQTLPARQDSRASLLSSDLPPSEAHGPV